MKKLILSIAAILASASMTIAFAQDDDREVKRGWSFGVLPTATFSTDNGYQAGAFGDVYYYGNGDTYPDPLHKISWEASYFTHSHRMRFYLAYDSKYLIPNMRLNASVTYVTDPLYSFWGFNGPAAVQNYDVWFNRDMTLPNGNNVNYYGMGRDMLRVLANVQGRITDNLNWAAGINFWNWKLGNMRDNGVKDDNGNKMFYDTNMTLFQQYQTLGLISDEEVNGGTTLEVNAGVVYDTRDIEAAPNHGIWAEAYLNGNVLGQRYLKACAYFRQYIALPINFIRAGQPVFAYRLAWQQTIAGETPLYMIQNIPLLVQRNMISEGFGSNGTIRGLRENRILTEGMAWVNTELRVKLVNFRLLNQYFYIAVNPFFDAGVITKQYKEAELAAAADANGKIYDARLAAIGQDTVIYDATKAGNLVYSGGIGLKIAMNQNFIVSAEYAHCFVSDLVADPWIGIGINYQF